MNRKVSFIVMGLMALNAIQCRNVGAFDGQNKPMSADEAVNIYPIDKVELRSLRCCHTRSQPTRAGGQAVRVHPEVPQVTFYRTNIQRKLQRNKVN